MRPATGAAALLAAAVAVGSGCKSEPDPQDVEGIGYSEDGFFRTLDLEGVPPERAYEAARGVLRRVFAGGPLVENEGNHTIELVRPSSRGPYRLRLYLHVAWRPQGSRVEILAEVDELVEEPEPGEDPWRPLGERAADLENALFAAIWNAVHPSLQAPP